MGGLHNFMQWHKPMLTGSGGFQVFPGKMRKIDDDGVTFRSHIDGSPAVLPESLIQIQQNLAHIIMALTNALTPSIALISNKPWSARTAGRAAVWTPRPVTTRRFLHRARRNLPRLVERSAREITSGLPRARDWRLSVGESKEDMYASIASSIRSYLPTSRGT